MVAKMIYKNVRVLKCNLNKKETYDCTFYLGNEGIKNVERVSTISSNNIFWHTSTGLGRVELRSSFAKKRFTCELFGHPSNKYIHCENPN